MMQKKKIKTLHCVLATVAHFKFAACYTILLKLGVAHFCSFVWELTASVLFGFFFVCLVLFIFFHDTLNPFNDWTV